MVGSKKKYWLVLILVINLICSCTKNFNSSLLYVNKENYDSLPFLAIDCKGLNFKKMDFNYQGKDNFNYRISLFRDGHPFISSEWTTGFSNFKFENEFISEIYLVALEDDFLLIEVKDKTKNKSFFFKPILIKNCD